MPEAVKQCMGMTKVDEDSKAGEDEVEKLDCCCSRGL